MINQAIELLNECVGEPSMKKNAFITSAMMKEMALLAKKSEESQVWQVAGLLYDLDGCIDKLHLVPQLHGLKTVEILKDRQIGNEQIYGAIAAHSAASGVVADEMMHKALIVADGVMESVLQTHHWGEVSSEECLNHCTQKETERARQRDALREFCVAFDLEEKDVLKRLKDIAMAKMKEK